MDTDASGRVLLYRAISPAERDALIRHGDWEWAPSGGGKYFSFSKTDVMEAAKKLYDEDVTIVETAVPRGFIPNEPDVRETVAQPHIPAKGGAASMIHGEVYVFYDPKAGGWSLHVDDDALLVMNAQMTRPKIIASRQPTVGRAPSGSTPPGHDGEPDHQESEGTAPGAGGGAPGRRVGAGRPNLPADSEFDEEGDAGGGLTQEEIEALTSPDAFEAMNGRGNWSLLALIGSAVLSKWMNQMAADIEQQTVERVKQQVAAVLTAYVGQIVVLQEKGAIAYANVTVSKTVADSLTVFDLESVDVTEWYKQGVKREGGVSGLIGTDLGVNITHETSSFALNLHPVVLAWAMAQLDGRLKTLETQITGLTKSGQAVPDALRQQHRALRGCATRLAKLGPSKPSFGFVGGECLDLLPSDGPRH
ncbi:MAG TPA: hypothetical protein VNV17_09170 [Solirubrobacteraceae bacterium]|nr:hypothetical protein [Solirubrobacteraceae bacterium]